ncbi:MAG: PIN domain-containing protein [Candidatus Hydrothermarchaeota archaeon]
MGSYVKVILDTNFLMLPGRLGIDIFKEIDRELCANHKLFVLSTTEKELKNLVENAKGSEKKIAKIGLELIGRCEILPAEREPDIAIFDFINENTVVATTDKELRKKLRKKGVKTLYLAQGAYIRMD